MKKLINIQEAFQRSVTAERDRVSMVNGNFKINPMKKMLAEQVCEKSGTTLSSFLRECVDSLVTEFIGEKELKNFMNSNPEQ